VRTNPLRKEEESMADEASRPRFQTDERDEDVELHTDEALADEASKGAEDKPEDRTGDDFQLHTDEAL
jgi:hypothetical protein